MTSEGIAGSRRADCPGDEDTGRGFVFVLGLSGLEIRVIHAIARNGLSELLRT